MKMPRKVSTTNNSQGALPQTPLPNPNRCQFETSDGRRCRMLRCNAHPTLCLFHARDEMQLLESQRLGAELSASLTGQFMTATDINFDLGKLFTATAQNRIPPRNAAVLAYIGQLMLHSLPNLKKEYTFVYKYESWNKMLDNATCLSNSTLGDLAPESLDAPATDSPTDRRSSESRPISVGMSNATDSPPPMGRDSDDRRS